MKIFKAVLLLSFLIASVSVGIAKAEDPLCASIHTTQNSQLSFSDFLPGQKAFAGKQKWHNALLDGDKNAPLDPQALAQWQKQTAGPIEERMVSACEKASLIEPDKLVTSPMSNAVFNACQDTCKKVFTDYKADSPSQCQSVCSDYRAEFSKREALRPKTIAVEEPKAPVQTIICPTIDVLPPVPEAVVKIMPRVLGITPLTAVLKGRVSFSKAWKTKFESGKQEIFFPDNPRCGVFYDPIMVGDQTFDGTDLYYIRGVKQQKDRVELTISNEIRSVGGSEFGYGFFCMNHPDGSPATVDDFNLTDSKAAAAPLAHLSLNLLSIDR